MTIKKTTIQVVNKSNYPLPSYATEGSAGMDLYADIDENMTLEFGKVSLVPTGIYIKLPVGYEAQIRARSGLALKHGVSLVNGVGTIDSDYRGEIKVIMTLLKDEPFVITPGMRIAQMVISEYVKAEFEVVNSLDETERGDGGFGHSGK